MKIRLDKLLVAKGLADTLKQAQALIMTGELLVDDRPMTTPGAEVDESADVRLKEERLPFVSRGGVKLEHALQELRLSLEGKIALDVGASTGGFTDCLLQRSIAKVYAVDVGHGQLHEKLRCDPRVVVLDRTNVRHLKREEFPDPIDIVTIDLSFISAASILPVIEGLLDRASDIIVLVKPQFELEKERVGAGGIVRDSSDHQLAVDHVSRAGEALGWSLERVILSPILGAKGNREFFVIFYHC